MRNYQHRTTVSAFGTGKMSDIIARAIKFFGIGNIANASVPVLVTDYCVSTSWEDVANNANLTGGLFASSAFAFGVGVRDMFDVFV